MMNEKQFDTFFKRLCETTPISSQVDLAKTLKISRAAITQAKKNDTVPSKWITELSSIYDVNPEWLLKGSGDKLLLHNKFSEIYIQIPKVKARLSAGGGSFETESEIENFYSFRKDWLSKNGNANNMILMDIVGTSMLPELKEGDTVLIDQSEKAILAGAIYAIGLDDTILVKRVEKRPNEVVLISENKDYDILSFKGEELNSVQIIGRVIWVCRELI